MTTTANHEAYGNPGWSNAPWGSPPPNQGPPPGWGEPPFWHPYWLPRPLGIAAMVLGFVFFWPIGLAILLVMLATGRIGCRGRRAWTAWQMGGPQGNGQPGPRWGGTPPWAGWCNRNGADRSPPSSGNRAFDEYRMETIRRLEEEQKEFGSFLDRLRFAKDKAEFDQFMAELRQRPPAPPVPPEEPAHG